MGQEIVDIAKTIDAMIQAHAARGDKEGGDMANKPDPRRHKGRTSTSNHDVLVDACAVGKNESYEEVLRDDCIASNPIPRQLESVI